MASDELVTEALADVFSQQLEISGEMKRVKNGLSKAIEGLQEASQGMECIDQKSDAIIEALRGMAERSAEAEKWRTKAEERLSALEAWRDEQEAS